MGAARLFLALVVAADHWRQLVLDPSDIVVTQRLQFGFNAGYAVMFFYVISGFLITYTLSTNYEPDLRGALAFYRNRIARIFSLYWPLVLIAFAAREGAWANFLSSSAADKFTQLFLLGMDWRIAFAAYPEEHWDAAVTGLHQAWTLGAELSFYIVAPLLMRSWKAGAAIALASLAVRFSFVAALGNDIHAVWTYLFAGSTAVFFMLGHLVCIAARRHNVLSKQSVGIPLVIASFLLVEFGPRDGFDGTRFWPAALLFALGLPGLFRATKDQRFLNYLGDLSYPVYLIHNLVLVWSVDTIMRALAPAPGINQLAGIATIVAFLAATVVAAAVVHSVLERPISRVLRRTPKDPMAVSASAVP